jgi:molybdopterin molybdotransferase
MRVEDPAPAIRRLLDRLRPVDVETVGLGRAHGRVLAQPIVTDRPSPAADVTAMDGYAVRLADLPGEVPVGGEVAIGHAPPPLPPGAAMRVFTGAAVPGEADAVIKREDVTERDGSIVVPDAFEVLSGQHIRRRGENLDAGQTVVEPGVGVDAPVAAALATFGITSPEVFRRVRVGMVATGDEVLDPADDPSPFQLRDSNTSAVTAMFGPFPWVEMAAAERRVDNLEMLTKTLAAQLETCDAVFLSGGVSMGDYDFVPEAIEAIGGEIVFHRLRQRPGKPLLGAVAPGGKPIMGLPGNPVSVMVTARRYGLAALRALGGFADPDPPVPAVELADDDGATLDLWWHRLVRLDDEGRGRLVPSQGSGDMVSAARSHGFVVVPPGRGGPGPWPFYGWGGS